MKFNSHNFSEFTYSKKTHFRLFGDLDLELYKEKKIPVDCDLKVYQDLLVLGFIRENITEGSKILEIGGGKSRIINYLKESYEFWNLDKLEGLGNGPKKINADGFRLVRDYIGNFNSELKEGYFDFVFSISVMEHLPQDEIKLFKRIVQDINRVLKPGELSLHCVDALLKENKVWIHPFLKYSFEQYNTINSFTEYLYIKNDPDVYFMSETAYDRYWKQLTKKSYLEQGKPFSCNVLWEGPV